MADISLGNWSFGRKDQLKDWPRLPDGTLEPAARLALQSELDGIADITLSLLHNCGIPAFKEGYAGQVILGFTMQGVDICVPASRLEEAQALLAAPATCPKKFDT